MSNVEGFGDPKHGADRKGFPEGLKDGFQEHRILPPILNQIETGKYVRDHTCHYGYGIKMNNSDKELPNPFYCVEEGKFVAGKFVVFVQCPECQEIKRVKAEADAIEADMKKNKASDAEIAAALAPHNKWLQKHNRDFKHYLNVKGSDGRYFTVKYPSKKVWKVIEALITKYKNARIPIDGVAASQGLWFRIGRSGKGFKTDYTVELVTEDVIINGQVVEGAEKPKLGPLTAEDAKKAKESCLDLGDVGIRRLSIEQVQRLVLSRGDPAVIQAIFAGSDETAKVEQRPEPEDVPEASPEVGNSLPESTPAEKAARPEQPPQDNAHVAPGCEPFPEAKAAPPVTAPPTAARTQADLLAEARKLVEQARSMGPVTQPSATAPAKAPAVTTPSAPVTTPAPVVVPATSTKPPVVAPTPAPKETPVAATSEGELSFLSQFN